MIEQISHDAAYAMLDLPGIKERFPVKPHSLSSEYATFLVNGRMLVGLKANTAIDIEFHAMSPRQHWPSIREDVKALIGHLKDGGYINIYTGINCKYKRTQNLAIKCGFAEIYRVDDEVIFRCL